MYSDQFEGVHEHTSIAYDVTFPATPGPGGEWVAHWKTYRAQAEDAPETSVVYDTAMYNTYTFVTPQERQRWWQVVRKNIIWSRVPQPVSARHGYHVKVAKSWLDLAEVTTFPEGSAA
jgi:hypothetical protein